MPTPLCSFPDYSDRALRVAPAAADSTPQRPAWAAVGAVEPVAQPSLSDWSGPPAWGRLKKAAVSALFGAVFFVASAWSLHRDIQAARAGQIDMSAQAVRARQAGGGAAALPLDPDEFTRYAEAALYSRLAYKKEWRDEARAGVPHPAVRPTEFHSEQFGGFENNVSAMRVFQSAPPRRDLIISFSGSDDFLDFVRDSNGLGVLSGWISPQTSFEELEEGVREALDLIAARHADFDRILISGHSLGGHLANEFAHRLAASQGHELASPLLAKTELLTLNSLYFGRPEPLCLGRVLHFREAAELTDPVGRLSGLRPPSPAFVRRVSSSPVADAALAEQILLDRKIAERFSPLDLIRQIRIVFSYGIERMENMIGRHLGATAEARIHDALERSAVIADASGRGAGSELNFSAGSGQSWLRRAYGCNTLECASPAPAASADSSPPSARSPMALALQSARPAPCAVAPGGLGRMGAQLSRRRADSVSQSNGPGAPTLRA